MNYRALIVACAAVISGCASMGAGGPEGALASLGSGTRGGDGEVASAILQAMGGGIVASAAGDELDERERRKALEAEYRALEHTPSGQAVTWRGSDASRYGEVVAAQPYRVGSQDCRQYSHTVNLNGVQRAARGTACRNSDGSWTPLT